MPNSKKIKERIEKDKQKFLETIEQFPIIQLACIKSGISRQTYYRRINDDEEFALNAEKSYTIGKDMINDIAEGNIISGVKEKDIKSTMFWLNNNHKNYSNRPIQNTSIIISDPKKHSKAIEKILKVYNKTDAKKSKRKPNKTNCK